MIRIGIVALVVAALFACSSQTVEESAPAGIINVNCPQMGKPVDPEVATYNWNGKEIGFCCKGCNSKFAALDDAEKTAKLEASGTEL